MRAVRDDPVRILSEPPLSGSRQRRTTSLAVNPRPAASATATTTTNGPIFMSFLSVTPDSRVSAPPSALSRTTHTRQTDGPDVHARGAVQPARRAALSGFAPRIARSRPRAPGRAAQDEEALLVDTERFEHAQVLHHLARRELQVLHVDENGGALGRGEIGLQLGRRQDAGQLAPGVEIERQELGRGEDTEVAVWAPGGAGLRRPS